MPSCAGVISGKRIARAAHPNAVVCWRDLGQRHLVMPDALERRRVLARPHSSLSCADKHPKASACQVISGNVIVVCLFIALPVLPPNQNLVILSSPFDDDFDAVPRAILHDLPTPSCSRENIWGTQSQLYHRVWTARAGCWLPSLLSGRNRSALICRIERALVDHDSIHQV
jgi:hypothetical protein